MQQQQQQIPDLGIEARFWSGFRSALRGTAIASFVLLAGAAVIIAYTPIALLLCPMQVWRWLRA